MRKLEWQEDGHGLRKWEYREQSVGWKETVKMRGEKAALNRSDISTLGHEKGRGRVSNPRNKGKRLSPTHHDRYASQFFCGTGDGKDVRQTQELQARLDDKVGESEDDLVCQRRMMMVMMIQSGSLHELRDIDYFVNKPS